MKTFFYTFIVQFLIIGMVINVRTDIPFWKQLIAYVLIACIFPISELCGKKSNNSK